MCFYHNVNYLLKNEAKTLVNMKHTIKLNEEQFQAMVESAVRECLNNTELEEGFFKNLATGIRQGVQGYQGQKFADSDIAADYGDANYNYNAQIAGVRTKADAAKTVQKMMAQATQYDNYAKQLQSQLDAFNADKGIEYKQNRGANGRFQSGYKSYEKSGMGAPDFANAKSRVATQQANAAEMGRNALDGMIHECVDAAVREYLIQEGLWDNLKAGWNAMKRGYDTQRFMDNGTNRYMSNAEYRRNGLNNPFTANRPSAISKSDDIREKIRWYKEQAQALRAKARELAAKWNVQAIGNTVGVKAQNVKYGYGNAPAAGEAQPANI